MGPKGRTSSPVRNTSKAALLPSAWSEAFARLPVLRRLDALATSGASRIPHAALIFHLSRERSDLVASELVEAVARRPGSAGRELSQALSRRRMPHTRAAAAEALSRLQPHSARSTLSARLQVEKDPRVRLSLRAGLYRCGDRRQLGALLRGLRSPSYLLRARSANLLAQGIHREDVVAVRQELLKVKKEEASRSVRSALSKAMRRTGTPSSRNSLAT